MNKVNAVETKSASRLLAIYRPLDVAVRAAVALGAAAFVVSAPLVAYAAPPPDPYLIDGGDGRLYGQMSGSNSIDAWGDAPILANPNIGAQSEYEAYIRSLDPANRPEEASGAAEVIANPNFGAQSQYEAYIASLSPANRPAAIVNAAAVESSYPFVQANGAIISLGVNRMEAKEAAVVDSHAASVMNDRDERVFLESGSRAPLTISPHGWPVAAASASNGMEANAAGKGDVNLANSAPSSAAVANEYTEGYAQDIGARNVAALEEFYALRAAPVVKVPGNPSRAAAIPYESSVAPSITVIDASVSSEGYDWYIDPVALRAATIPNKSSNAASITVIDASFSSEGYDWYVDPVALRAATIPNKSALAVGSAGVDRYNWDADPELLLQPQGSQRVVRVVQGTVARTNVLRAPQDTADVPDVLRDPQVTAVVPDVLRGPYDAPASSLVAAQPALSPEQQLQALYQNGHITRGVMEAEVAAQANMARGNVQVIPSALSPEEQLLSLYEKGHLSYELTQAEIAAYAYVPPAGVQVAQSSEAAEAELQALYQNGHISRAVMEAVRSAFRSDGAEPALPSMAVSKPEEKVLTIRQTGPVS